MKHPAFVYDANDFINLMQTSCAINPNTGEAGELVGIIISVFRETSPMLVPKPVYLDLTNLTFFTPNSFPNITFKNILYAEPPAIALAQRRYEDKHRGNRNDATAELPNSKFEFDLTQPAPNSLRGPGTIKIHPEYTQADFAFFSKDEVLLLARYSNELTVSPSQFDFGSMTGNSNRGKHQTLKIEADLNIVQNGGITGQQLFNTLNQDLGYLSVINGEPCPPFWIPTSSFASMQLPTIFLQRRPELLCEKDWPARLHLAWNVFAKEETNWIEKVENEIEAKIDGKNEDQKKAIIKDYFNSLFKKDKKAGKK